MIPILPILPIIPILRRSHLRDTMHALAVVVAVLALQLDGCTLIGFGIGLNHDAHKPKSGPIPGEMWDSIPIGAQVIVQFADGAQSKGLFFGSEPLTREGYDSVDVLWLEKHSLPPMTVAPGETPSLTVLTLQTKTSLEYIPKNRIAGISYPGKHGALVGLAIGFGVDLVCLGLTYLFLTLLEDSWGDESWGI